MKVMSAL